MFSLLLAIVSGVGLWLAWESLLHHTAMANGLASPESALCNVSATVNCDAVNKSSWSSLLGLPVASYGVFYYLGLLGAAGLGTTLPVAARSRYLCALTAITGLGVALSIALFLISKFVIGALCPLCLATYATNGILFLLCWRSSKDTPASQRIPTGVSALVSSLKELIAPTSNRNWVTAFIFAAFLAGSAYLTLQSPALSLQKLRAPRAVGSENLSPADQRKAAIQRTIEVWERGPQIKLPEGIEELADYSKGPANAPVRIVEFSDYQCPFCRNLFNSLEPILERYKEKVHVTMLNFPIDNSCNPQIPREGHSLACYAAAFAICAGEQGRFWDTAEYLYSLPELEGQVTKADGIAAINGAMMRLSLDSDGMQSCLASNRPAARIASDVATAVAVGLRGTPMVIVNGRMVPTPTPDAIEAILAKLAGPVKAESP